MKRWLAMGTGLWLMISASGAVSSAEAAVTAADEPATWPLRLSDLHSSFVLAQQRAALLRELKDKKIRDTFAQPLTTATEAGWRGGLWAAGLLQQRDATVREALRTLLRAHASLGAETQRQALETAYGLFPSEFADEMSSVVQTTTNPKLFAMAALHLMRQRGAGRKAWPDVAALMRQQFPRWRTEPILLALEADATCGRASGLPMRKPPPLEPLLAPSFAPGRPVIYSLQRRNRDYEGRAIVRRADGRFVRNPDGSLFSVGQMARSNSNLPGYLTNGNTPQGVFTIVGLGVARTNKFIGPTPFLESMLPVEATPDTWFHDPALAGTSWTLEMYLSFLPPGEWRVAASMLEAWYAGTAGRSEMLTHGTCIDPDYYKGMPWHPNSPSLGCLTALELWDGASGRALRSDQLSLVQAFMAAAANRDLSGAPPGPASQPKGYLVVIEISDEARPVSPSEAERLVRRTSRQK
ncbi:MAG: hypothetical protein N2111_04915 [Candidatus Sumerlaeaceae bacterium]|nr:hypothetical protein [Candidatus Sumerlaeaceae bacterium]